jgi:2-polyprenyl-3-methyl-5-hydroxy-6-metoxy-1,4-benzoquinol methylase
MKSIKSPLTGNDNIYHIGTIKTKYLKGKYLETFGIKVNEIFGNLNEVEIYVCGDTGYRFYYPYNISGDGKFYEDLEKFDWYYMPWKWEHTKVVEMLTPGMNLLEVGCGQGGFLEGVLKRVSKINVTGLELNINAVELCRLKGLNVFSQSVQKFSFSNVEFYDIVCSFQVLEHISDVGSFIDANLKLLKKNGYLIFSVPNNDSFPKYDSLNDILNMPPHHMGLWSKKSLKNLESIFPMKCIIQLNEPLQDYHLNWWLRVFEKRLKQKKHLFYFIYCSLRINKILKIFLRKFPHLVNGHTTLAVYKKN